MNIHLPARRRAPRQRPAEILAAAMEEFAEKGFAAARLDDVARRAGCSKAAIYLYYRDKAALFEEVIRHSVVADIEDIARNLTAAPMTAPEKLRFVIRAFGARIAEGTMPSICKLVIGESRAFPELARLWHREVISRAEPLMTGIIGEGIFARQFRAVDPAHAIRSIVGPMLLTSLWRSVFEPIGAEPVNVADFIDTHIDFVLAALAEPDPGAAPQ